MDQVDQLTDPYAVLELSPDASDEEVKRAYRRLAMTHHPDRGGSISRFVRLQRAYDVLADPQARASLDASLAARRLRMRSEARAAAQREQRRRRAERARSVGVRGADVEQVYLLDQPDDRVTVPLGSGRTIELREQGTWVFRGRGELGTAGGPAGDLRVVVRWSPQRERHEARRRLLVRVGVDTADTVMAMLLGIIAALMLLLLGAVAASLLL